MAYTVRDWMIDVIVFVDPEVPVSEALAIMRRRYIHSVIVNRSETNPEYGIITSTDICDKIVAQGKDPTQLKAKEIMNSPLITVNRNMDIRDCAKKMREHQIHHLPVTDDSGDLKGMISATDFLVVAEALGRAPGVRLT